MKNGSIDGRIKFRHLQSFLAVAHSGNFQKAADALSITQPAVSKTVKELETILGLVLFDRRQKGTTLTAAAESFLNHAEACMSELKLAINFSVQPRDTSSLVRIGAVPTLAASFLPQTLLKFFELAKNTRVSVLTGTTADLLAQLRESECDFVLCRHRDPEQMVGLAFEYLFADPLVVVVRSDHPLLTTPVVDIPQSASFVAILPIKGSINRDAADNYARTLGIDLSTSIIECVSVSFGKACTLDSDAIWFTSWEAVKREVEMGTLSKLPPQATYVHDSVALMARSVGLIMRTNSIPTSIERTFIDAVREYALERRQRKFPG